MLLKSISVIILFIITISICNFAVAGNGYDDQEAIRRAAQQLVDIDRNERRKARERYDNAHSTPSSYDAGNDLPCCAVTIILLLLIVFAMFLPFLNKKSSPIRASTNNTHKNQSNTKNPKSFTTMSDKIIKEQKEKHTMVIASNNKAQTSTKFSNSDIDKAVYDAVNTSEDTMMSPSTNESRKNSEIKTIQSSIEERLIKLSHLKEKHLISEDDYQKKKNEILDLL